MSFASARTKAGLSQRVVAERLNVSPAAVALWDSEKTMPRAALLPEIARLYNCTVDELLKPDKRGEAQSHDTAQ